MEKLFLFFVGTLELVQLLWLLSVFVSFLLLYPSSNFYLFVLGVAATFLRLVCDCAAAESTTAGGEKQNENADAGKLV